MAQTTPQPRRILCLDGGGVRGVVELAFLARIEELLRSRVSSPHFRLCDYFDLIGGASTGAIIAAGLATGRSVAEITTLYRELAPKVFKRRWTRPSGIRARFDSRPLVEYLARELGDITLDSDRLLTRLAIVIKRADTGSPWIVSNIPTQPYWNDPDQGGFIGNRHFSVAALVRASTAAPYYFVPERIPILASADPGLFIDGGITPFNNPSIPMLMLATMQAFGLRWPLGPQSLSMISVGAGSFRRTVQAGRSGALSPMRLALNTTLGVIGDCQNASTMLMQWMAECPRPWVVNSEIGDLTGEYLAGRPLLLYQRYDVRLEADWLKAELDFDCDARMLKKFQRLDEPATIPLLWRIATLAAAKQIDASHFPPHFDCERADG